MEYGKLGKSEPRSDHEAPEVTSSSSRPLNYEPATSTSPTRTKKRLITVLLSLLALVLIAASVSSAVLLISRRGEDSSNAPPATHRKPTKAISKACSKTLYQSLCEQTLMEFPGGPAAATEDDLVHVSFNMTLQHISRALYVSSGISALNMEPRARSAYEDCLELLDDSVNALTRSLSAIGIGTGVGADNEDVVSWLSAALTNQDTCAEGFEDVGPGEEVKGKMQDGLKDLSELISNCLAIFSAAGGGDFSGVPIQNRRRRLMAAEEGLPEWLGREERRLLGLPVGAIQADFVVSKDGNGTYKTIGEAIKKAPEHSSRRIIIYVKAGRYEEDNLKVGRKKTNLMFIGDGKGKTIISGGKSVMDKMTTFHTASFAATGAGFIARDMTFENWAGPAKHQAVALRVGADHAVVYRCSIIGYQDTLYVHSNRQFFRECDVYGTVDFIFGNAAVVFQNCSMYARKPMDQQKNTITAQNRKDPNQNTGISIHACRILATSDLEASKDKFQTYLGRPWKLYSRTVYMLSYMGDHIHPKGWLEWNATFALDTLYYGEYMNYGPGAALGQRVKWPGYRVITSVVEASKFTVAQFIYGSSWLPSTGVAFLAGLAV